MTEKNGISTVPWGTPEVPTRGLSSSFNHSYAAWLNFDITHASDHLLACWICRQQSIYIYIYTIYILYTLVHFLYHCGILFARIHWQGGRNFQLLPDEHELWKSQVLKLKVKTNITMYHLNKRPGSWLLEWDLTASCVDTKSVTGTWTAWKCQEGSGPCGRYVRWSAWTLAESVIFGFDLCVFPETFLNTLVRRWWGANMKKVFG